MTFLSVPYLVATPGTEQAYRRVQCCSSLVVAEAFEVFLFPTTGWRLVALGKKVELVRG